MVSQTKGSMNFKKAAVYKIIVKGKIYEGFTERMQGMQLKVESGTNRESYSTLVGEIRDQAALSGILNDLYDMHMTVISVNMLTDISDD